MKKLKKNLQNISIDKPPQNKKIGGQIEQLQG